MKFELIFGLKCGIFSRCKEAKINPPLLGFSDLESTFNTYLTVGIWKGKYKYKYKHKQFPQAHIRINPIALYISTNQIRHIGMSLQLTQDFEFQNLSQT